MKIKIVILLALSALLIGCDSTKYKYTITVAGETIQYTSPIFCYEDTYDVFFGNDYLYGGCKSSVGSWRVSYNNITSFSREVLSEE